MSNELHLSAEELEAGLETIRQSPKDNGELALIVRRPQSNEREILAIGELDPKYGLVGDNWCERASADGRQTAHCR